MSNFETIKQTLVSFQLSEYIGGIHLYSVQNQIQDLIADQVKQAQSPRKVLSLKIIVNRGKEVLADFKTMR